jgi:hypothetical protein
MAEETTRGSAVEVTGTSRELFLRLYLSALRTAFGSGHGPRTPYLDPLASPPGPPTSRRCAFRRAFASCSLMKRSAFSPLSTSLSLQSRQRDDRPSRLRRLRGNCSFGFASPHSEHCLVWPTRFTLRPGPESTRGLGSIPRNASKHEAKDPDCPCDEAAGIKPWRLPTRYLALGTRTKATPLPGFIASTSQPASNQDLE